MSRILILTALMTTSLIICGICQAQSPMPQAPAKLSWLPHGYGGRMYLDNTMWTRMKGLHGFRDTPVHIGCWSHPLWGWDVNGYYCGPQVPHPDPAKFQLPIGLIYPENGPPIPPRRGVRKVSRQGH
jgi:hypothetical protein